MSTLLLRLAAPLMAWGASSRFNKRTTNREPTKSGVIGLAAAALGRSRSDSLEDLRQLRFGVRIDQAGALLKDFHTAHTADGSQSFISDRYYLADAVFLAGLEGDAALLRSIDAAIRRPFYPLYLGRRSCPPVGRISLGLRDLPLLAALKNEPWLASAWYGQKLREKSQVDLAIVYDADPKDFGAYSQRDLPLAFDQLNREYTFRSLVNDLKGANKPNPYFRGRNEAATDHDPMLELEGS